MYRTKRTKRIKVRRYLSENPQQPSGWLGKLIGTTGQEVITIKTEVEFTPEGQKTLINTAKILAGGAIIATLINKL